MLRRKNRKAVTFNRQKRRNKDSSFKIKKSRNLKTKIKNRQIILCSIPTMTTQQTIQIYLKLKTLFLQVNLMNLKYLKINRNQKMCQRILLNWLKMKIKKKNSKTIKILQCLKYQRKIRSNKQWAQIRQTPVYYLLIKIPMRKTQLVSKALSKIIKLTFLVKTAKVSKSKLKKQKLNKQTKINNQTKYMIKIFLLMTTRITLKLLLLKILRMIRVKTR